MLDDQEIYKHLETNPTTSTTKDIAIILVDLLETKLKRSEKKQFLE